MSKKLMLIAALLIGLGAPTMAHEGHEAATGDKTQKDQSMKMDDGHKDHKHNDHKDMKGKKKHKKAKAGDQHTEVPAAAPAPKK